MRFLAETPCAILVGMLEKFLRFCFFFSRKRLSVLGGVGLVVHEKELNLGGVVDEESLVAGRHHVAGLLVGTVTNL